MKTLFSVIMFAILVITVILQQLQIEDLRGRIGTQAFDIVELQTALRKDEKLLRALADAYFELHDTMIIEARKELHRWIQNKADQNEKRREVKSK